MENINVDKNCMIKIKFLMNSPNTNILYVKNQNLNLKKFFVVEMLFYILYLSLVTRVSALYININYSFKLPEVFGIGNHNDSSCCPFLIYPKNDTGGLRVPDFLIIGVQKACTYQIYTIPLFLKYHISLKHIL